MRTSWRAGVTGCASTRPCESPEKAAAEGDEPGEDCGGDTGDEDGGFGSVEEAAWQQAGLEGDEGGKGEPEKRAERVEAE